MGLLHSGEPRPQTEIVENPDIMGGAPCVAGTRGPATTVIVQIRAGYDKEAIFRHYPSLPVDGIDAVRRWAEARGIDLTAANPAE